MYTDNKELTEKFSVLLTLSSQFTEIETQNFSARSNRQKRYNSTHGKFSGGIKLFGYTTDENGYYVINNSEAEIAAVAVDESYSKLGIGVKLINFLLKKAKEKSLQSVFVLTTQTADWFEKLGFKEDSIESLPPERKKLWTPKRNSKVLRLNLFQ